MAQAQPLFTPPPRPLGFDEPLVDFELETVAGARFRLSDHPNVVTVIDFWSAECPVSQHFDPYLNGFARAYGPKGVTLVAIDSNVYQDEAAIGRTMQKHEIAFPVLRDPANRLADYFGAQTTPHVFVFDSAGRLRYRGAINDITFERKEPTVNFLEEAVDALLLGEEVQRRESPPYGCTINRA